MLYYLETKLSKPIAKQKTCNFFVNMFVSNILKTIKGLNF